MKTKHTPGPWYAKCGYKMLTISNRKTACINAVTIAEVVNPCGPDYKANAKLLAAAPELLELVELVHLSFGGGNVITFSEDDIKEFESIYKKATE